MHPDAHCGQDVAITKCLLAAGQLRSGIYTPAEYYSAMRRDETQPFATTCMGLESVILTDMGHMEKDKDHMVPLVCGT